jgi:hypothetical protein
MEKIIFTKDGETKEILVKKSKMIYVFPMFVLMKRKM